MLTACLTDEKAPQTTAATPQTIRITSSSGAYASWFNDPAHQPANTYVAASVYAEEASAPLYCTDKSAVAVIRKWLIQKDTVSVLITADVIEAGKKIVSVPVFQYYADEANSACKVSLKGLEDNPVELVPFAPADRATSYRIDYSVHVQKKAAIDASKRVLSLANKLVGLAGPEGAVAAIVSDQVLSDVAAEIDNELTSNFSQESGLDATLLLPFRNVAPGDQSVPKNKHSIYAASLVPTVGGVSMLGTEKPSANLIVKYKASVLGNPYPDDASRVLTAPIYIDGQRSTVEKAFAAPVALLKAAETNEQANDACESLTLAANEYLTSQDVRALRLASLVFYRGSSEEKFKQSLVAPNCYDPNNDHAFMTAMAPAWDARFVAIETKEVNEVSAAATQNQYNDRVMRVLRGIRSSDISALTAESAANVDFETLDNDTAAAFGMSTTLVKGTDAMQAVRKIGSKDRVFGAACFRHFADGQGMASVALLAPRNDKYGIVLRFASSDSSEKVQHISFGSIDSLKANYGDQMAINGKSWPNPDDTSACKGLIEASH
jgi:hypothetical protein